MPGILPAPSKSCPVTAALCDLVQPDFRAAPQRIPSLPLPSPRWEVGEGLGDPQGVAVPFPPGPMVTEETPSPAGPEASSSVAS